MKLYKISLIILTLVFIGQLVYFYPQLPAVIASHFDASGQANDWMAKSSFSAFEVVLLLVIVGLGLFLPRLIAGMSNSTLNFPNKEYWLAPERREQTLNEFWGIFGWTFVGVVALLIGINQIVLRSNVLHQEPSPVMLWIILGAFFAVDLIIIISLFRQFSIKSKNLG